ncbi:MAG TPA: cation-translocating P-type ATPase [Bacillota bacterium]|nr:cation-translocating P-type ATPase [Bacillota bacterium]HQD73911.1 cation-translocating P-type ATPase [Bacillota bacterium]
MSEHASKEFSFVNLLPSLIGIVGIIMGLILKHLGHSFYPIPYLAATVIAGYPVAKEGLKTLLSGHGLDINFLTTVAGIGAVILGEFGEAAAVLTLFSIGEYLEERAEDRSRKSIREMMDLAPMTARIKSGDVLMEIPAERISPGDIVYVLPGEKVPVDGQVLSGRSHVDESVISGESMPVDKEEGSIVFAGSFNLEGSLEVCVTKPSYDTTLAHIIEMIEEAQSKKAESQKIVDRFARIWTPLMLALSLILAVLVPVVFRQEFRPWIYRSLTVLIVSCPCSLVISTPVTVVASITRAARDGILVKGGIHLEQLGRIRAVALDKTGTITQNKVVVEQILPLGKETVESLLFNAATVECTSEHPLAKAIVEEAQKREIEVDFPDEFKAIPGKGAIAISSDRTILAGNENLFSEQGIEIPMLIKSEADRFKEKGKTVVYVGVESNILGMLVLSDQIRPEAPEAISQLHQRGIETIMISGDDAKTAAAVAAEVGISQVYAGLLPYEKVDLIKELKREWDYVAMVGDGINDAPSLAEATVGIAMGSGTDITLETADVVLMRPDLLMIPTAIDIAKQSTGLITQNISFSVAVKLLALVAVFAGTLPLWLAVLVDSGAAVVVTFNGLRILRYLR